MFAITMESKAQHTHQSLNLETEPVAYIMDGAGFTGAYQHGAWTYSIEAYGLKIPESMHGNQAFSADLKGIGLQFERFISGTDGFFAGPEISFTTLDLTHDPSGNTESHFNYAFGVRAGYHWNTGLGNLYLSPVLGLSYALNSENININNDTFESGPVTPWGTIGIGWSFDSMFKNE